MKKRLVKKWIKRYLHPIVKDLPKIDTYMHYEDEYITGLAQRRVYQSVSLANGYVIGEGERLKQGNGLRLNIIRTHHTLKQLMAGSRKSFLRWYPDCRNGYVYVRIAVEVR